MQTVTVRGVWLPGHVAQVAVWERDPRHPRGELYLTSGQVDTVCLTPGVNAALTRGSLALVEEAPTVEESVSALEPEIAQAEPAVEAAAKAADTKVTKRR